jgi:omega-6 fatty acid desaturase (delta-12 desaturase)
MYFISRVSIWLTAPLAVLAGGFLVRIFIIFHDCTHNSFFKTSRANSFWGFVTGVLCFTPYHHWKWEHTIHHAHSGNLDRRGLGEVWTFTVDEYLNAPLLTRIRYRITRNPVVLFVVAPTILFLVLHRIPSRGANVRARRSVHLTTLAAVVTGLGLSFFFGWQAYALIQFVAIFVAASAGVWLFYVQHQFEGVEWKRDEDWNCAESAMRGSSFYRLPKILQWFTGNIGFHHLHHLCPQIPNYHLPECNEAHAVFRAVPGITLRSSLKSFRLRLWDEQEGRLVCYRGLKERKRVLQVILEKNLVT